MTTILSLPLVFVTMETAANEDWLDAIQFLDAGSAPIDLTGIAFHSMLRPKSREVMSYALTSTEVSFEGESPVGIFLIGGTGNSVLAWTVLKSAMSRIPPGEYLVDAIAIADGHTRRVVTGTVIHVAGVTR